jgi:hypothetical protein
MEDREAPWWGPVLACIVLAGTGIVAYFTFLKSHISTAPSGANAAQAKLDAAEAARSPKPAPVLNASTKSSTQIVLTWSPYSERPKQVEIQRASKLEDSAFAQVAVRQAEDKTFEDQGLTPGKTYFYRIRYKNDAGPSAFSSVVRATTPAVPSSTPTVPEPPKDLKAFWNESKEVVELSWTNSFPKDQPEVSRSADGGKNFPDIKELDADALSATDSDGLLRGRTYWYRVRVKNRAGVWSDYTAPVSLEVPRPPPPPPPQGDILLVVIDTKPIDKDLANKDSVLRAQLKKLEEFYGKRLVGESYYLLSRDSLAARDRAPAERKKYQDDTEEGNIDKAFRAARTEVEKLAKQATGPTWKVFLIWKAAGNPEVDASLKKAVQDPETVLPKNYYLCWYGTEYSELPQHFCGPTHTFPLTGGGKELAEFIKQTVP